MWCSSTTQRNFLSKSTAENLSICMQCTYFILNHASFVQTGLLLDICLCMISNGGDYLWLLWNRWSIIIHVSFLHQFTTRRHLNLYQVQMRATFKVSIFYIILNFQHTCQFTFLVIINFWCCHLVILSCYYISGKDISTFRLI